jgi:hypothetical protein
MVGWIVNELRATLTVPAANITRSLIGGMEAIGHEAETVLTKKTHHHKICPAPARPRARLASLALKE